MGTRKAACVLFCATGDRGLVRLIDMDERTLEDIICRYPDLIENGLSFKGRQVTVNGKRVDVLFEDRHGQKLIVEIKKGTVLRTHVGQLLDYEGDFVSTDNPDVRVMLVGNRVPENLRRSLNHHGFEWKELTISALDIFLNEKDDFDLLNRLISKEPPIRDNKDIKQRSGSDSGQEYGPHHPGKNQTTVRNPKQNIKIDSILGVGERGSFDDIAGPISPKGVAFAQQMLRDSLEPIKESFNEYKVFPFSIDRALSLGFVLEYDPARKYGTKEFTRGGTWWAYTFGFSKDLPKNDVPNVSIMANSTGLDVALNAELMPSQKVMLRRIRESTSKFDRHLTDHGGLWLKTYLKFEHQPRIYHWILADIRPPGEFDGEFILSARRERDNAFVEDRGRRISDIKSMNKELTERQIRHLETHNKQLNLAIRLVQPFQKNAPFWSLPFNMKLNEIVGAVQRVKPLADFFLKEQ